MEIATIPAKDLRHTRVAQEWIEEGRQEGRQEGLQRAGRKASKREKPLSPSACSTVAAVPSAMQPQP